MSQKTVAQLHAEIASQLPTNAANQITASDVRGVLDDMVDSSGNLSDGTPVTIYSGDGTLSGDRAITGASHQLAFNSCANFSVNSGFSGNHYRIDCGVNSILLEVRGSSGGDGTATFTNNNFAFLNKSIGLDTSNFSVGVVYIYAGDISLSTFGATGNGILIGSSSTEKLAFLGKTPVPRTANANQAVATDPTSVITLANALRQEMIDRGFWKGSA